MLDQMAHEEIPELARIFRLDYDKNRVGYGLRSSCPTIDSEIGFDYKGATEYLKKHPEKVEDVTYKGETKPFVAVDGFNDNSCSADSLRTSTSKHGHLPPHLAARTNTNPSSRFLHSPLGWACIETSREEEAIQFLQTIRDIDPTPFLLQDNQGSLPIDGECILTSSIRMLRFLLEIYLEYDFICPNGGKMNEGNFHLLTNLCGSCWWEDIHEAHKDIVLGKRIVKGRNVHEDNLGIDDDFWARIILLAKAFYHKTIGVEPQTTEIGDEFLTISNDCGERTIQFRLLHACVGIDWFPPNLLKLLVAAFPHALLECDEDGDLPIHVAAGSVFDSYKIDATWEREFEAHSGYQKTTIDILLNANSQLAKIPNEEGKLPLELALDIECPVLYECVTKPWEDGGIGSLLDAFPEAAGIRSLVTGKSLLEIAIENHREWDDGIEALLWACPGAAESCNLYGKYPLEIAIERDTHFDEGIYGLLEASPAMIVEDKGYDIPFFARAASENCSVSVVYKILRMWPQSCKIVSLHQRCNTSNIKRKRNDVETISDLPMGKRKKTTP